MRSAPEIPVLSTERLILRGHRLDDFQSCASLWNDINVTHFITGKASTPAESWSRLLRYAGHWALLGYGFWAVEERATGRFVGDVGLADFKRDIRPDFGGAPEVGWVLATWAHGKGYATEAVTAALHWSTTNRRTQRHVCMIDPENAASRRVAEKCGFAPFAETTYLESAVVLMERLGEA
ncbi:MAG: GNAT family N-acetyltransferase [Kiloniellaceae bacterium]